MVPDTLVSQTSPGTMPLQSALPLGTVAAPTGPSAIPATPTAVEIDGYTYSQPSVARFLARLEVDPDLKNVQLKTSGTTLLGTTKVVSFTIISDIRKGRGAS